MHATLCGHVLHVMGHGCLINRGNVVLRSATTAFPIRRCRWPALRQSPVRSEHRRLTSPWHCFLGAIGATPTPGIQSRTAASSFESAATTGTSFHSFVGLRAQLSSTVSARPRTSFTCRIASLVCRTMLPYSDFIEQLHDPGNSRRSCAEAQMFPSPSKPRATACLHGTRPCRELLQRWLLSH